MENIASRSVDMNPQQPRREFNEQLQPVVTPCCFGSLASLALVLLIAASASANAVRAEKASLSHPSAGRARRSRGGFVFRH